MAAEATVLLVEDDADVRDVLAASLSKSFDLLVAASAADALRIIAARSVDLLVTDIVMPDMDGLDLADRATAMRPGLRVIYMTGYADPSRHSTRARHGRVIAKPFTPGRMAAEIRAALRETP
jgi:DNA-binding NtrC family response regulator